MELVFKAKQTTVSEQLEEYARKKLGRLDRYLPLAREATVELRHEATAPARERYVVQVTVNANGRFVRGEGRAAQPRVAIDMVADVLARQLQRHKQRLYQRGRSTSARESAPTPAEEEREEPVPLGGLVRVKRFPIKPMTPQEALEQMELLGHNFFLFYNAETDQYAVLYHRRDGDYGLILPEPS